MLCYSFLDKRGDYIKKLINWSLFTNELLVIEYKSIYCDYNDKVVIFKENDYINTIDLNKIKYIRENDEYKIEFDFNKLIYSVFLKDKKLNLSDRFIGSITNNNNIIDIKYNIDGNNMKLLIHLL